MSTLFGPVFSSRLGVSLGLDLLGGKICSMDCLYCEVGPTRALTVDRKPFVPARTILAAARQWKDAHSDGAARLDHVTLGGSGEPTLNRDLGTILSGLREIFPDVPLAVLTNASTLDDPAVRAELGAADVLLPSLDAVRPEVFARINRPAPGLSPARVMAGLLRLREAFHGTIRLETLLLAGINDSPADLDALAEFVLRLAPDRVDVTTLSRPGTDPDARAVDKSTIAQWTRRLDPNRPQAPEYSPTPEAKTGRGGIALAAEVLASLARRGQTLAGLAAGMGEKPETLAPLLAELVKHGHIRMQQFDTNGASPDKAAAEEPYYKVNADVGRATRGDGTRRRAPDRGE